MVSGKAKVTFAALLVVVAVTVFVFQHRAIEKLRQQNEQLERQLATAQVSVPVSQPSLDTNESARLQTQTRELIRLRGEVTLLRLERNELATNLAVAKAKSVTAPTRLQNVDTSWVEQVLSSPPAQQGMTAGTLRGKLLRGETTNVSPSELAVQNALAQRQLNKILERSPGEFADFQTAFIQGAVGISDATKLQQIHDLIQRTYEQAIASGLDVSSKPATDADAWVQQRFQLDRRATAAVEQLLTPEERRSFGYAFLGVMGVDLGTGDVDKSNYPKGFLGPP